MTICTRCDGTGFLNIHQVDQNIVGAGLEAVSAWMHANTEHDVQVCDCCGNGDGEWYGTPGYHYGPEDPRGPSGPYDYNGGLCECN
jgi:hypothetical protein